MLLEAVEACLSTQSLSSQKSKHHFVFGETSTIKKVKGKEFDTSSSHINSLNSPARPINSPTKKTISSPRHVQKKDNSSFHQISKHLQSPKLQRHGITSTLTGNSFGATPQGEQAN